MILAAINWDVDPALISFGGFEIRYYGLMWALAFGVGLLIFRNIFRRERIPMSVLDSLFVYVILATIIGARLGHCFFYDAGYYLSNPLKILKVWEGGLASHGAAIGILIGVWMFSRKFKMPYIWTLDRIGIVVAIGGAAIRLGNLFNSEIYGVETDMPWGFIFTRAGETVAKHPTQLYEALAYVIIFLILWAVYRYTKMAFKRPGAMFGIFLILLFASRFFIEFVKNPQEDFEMGLPLFMGQILSVPFVVAGVVILILAYSKNNIFKGEVPDFSKQLKAENEKNNKKK